MLAVPALARKTEKEHKLLLLSEIELVRDEMDKDHPNYPVITKIVKKLDYFKGKDDEKVLSLVAQGKYMRLKANSIIFRQGEKGEAFYVLLRGRVGILLSSCDFGDRFLMTKTCYDGDTFGEMPISLNAASSMCEFARDVTAITCEECDILEIDQQTRLQSISSDIEGFVSRRLDFLRDVPFFRTIEEDLLTEIAVNVELRQYKYGESLIRAGEEPDGAFVILSGQCQVVSESVELVKKGTAHP